MGRLPASPRRHKGLCKPPLDGGVKRAREAPAIFEVGVGGMQSGKKRVKVGDAASSPQSRAKAAKRRKRAGKRQRMLTASGSKYAGGGKALSGSEAGRLARQALAAADVSDETDEDDDTACLACGGGKWNEPGFNRAGDFIEGNWLLLCDREGCDGAYHTQCLKPVLAEVPEGDWFCCEKCQQAAAVRSSGAGPSGSSRFDSYEEAAEVMEVDCEEAGGGGGGGEEDEDEDEDEDEGSVSRMVSAGTTVWEGVPAAAVAPFSSQLELLCSAGRSLAPTVRDRADDEGEVLEADVQAPDPFDEDSEEEEEEEMPLQRRRPVPRDEA